MLKRKLIISIAAVSLGFFGSIAGISIAQSKTKTVSEGFSQAQMTRIAEVNDYLNELKTMQGDFLQIAYDGSVSRGKFYLQRPGRVRFEYAEPDMTILSDGTWVVMNDKELETVDRYPLRETPLNLLLKKAVNLSKDARVVSIESNNGLLSVTIREEDGFAQGEMTLVFSEPALELRHWRVVDAQGYATVVSLQNVERDMKLKSALFRAEQEEDMFDENEW